ncbi:MAG: aldose 1-epimerase family protein [Armatimonadetes bacterium]|nr:aldose 1-epimerase family protein [Armatimonadota bacterium]
MALLYGREYTRAELLARVGDISQLAGTRVCELQEGMEAGVRAVEFYTGSGFRFTALPSRGMDISRADWNGMSLAWRSSTGEVSPAYYEEPGLRWLRNFYGGLMVTCGLTYAGAPCEDGGKSLGLHGRVSNLAASCLWTDGEWQGDDYIFWAQGKVRETSVFGENVALTRRITCKLGENRLWVNDIVQNEGFQTAEHMLLYHINGGFPAVDAGSSLLAPSLRAVPRDADAEAARDRWHTFEPPTPGFREQVFYHDMAPDASGRATAALVNRSCGDGFGFYVSYYKNELPQFIQWKMNGQGTYTVGMEPANCKVEGRHKDRAAGILQFLEPGERREYRLEIGVLTCATEIVALEESLGQLKG